MWAKWIFLLEAIVIVTTNTITIATMTRTPRLRKRKYYLIVNLAVVDLLVGLLPLPLYYFILNGNIEPNLLVLFRTLDPFLGIASLLGLASIAIERAYATYYPFKHRTISKTPYIIGITVLWLTAGLFTVSVVIIVQTFGGLATTMLILTCISIALAIIICAYLLIWVKFSCMRSVLDHQVHQRNRKLSDTLAILTVVSQIAWVPFMVVSCACFYSRCVQIEVLFCKFLHYGNSFVNFIVYSLRMREFRLEMSRMLRIRTTAVQNNNNIELQNRACVVGRRNEIHANNAYNNDI